MYVYFSYISAVAEVKLRDDQYTLEHMHAFGMYNYLHCDSWYQDSVYYVDNLGRIMNLTVMLVRKKYTTRIFLQIWSLINVHIPLIQGILSSVFVRLHFCLIPF